MDRKLKKFISGSLFIVAVFFCIHPALEGSIDEESIKLIVGDTKIISTRSPTRVIIGNPQVADVVNVTNQEITVSAKSSGLTTLVYTDVFGEQSVNIKVIKEDVVELKRRIDNILQQLNLEEVYTKSQEDEGKVIILGRVKNTKDMERLTSALSDFKDKISDQAEVKEEESVVEIDVQILELDKDATNTLGFTWPGSLNLFEKGSPALGAAGTGLSTVFRITNLQRGVLNTTAADGSSIIDPFTLKLDALIQEGKARILSRPRLSCQSNKEAQLLVGGEQPILTTSVQSGGASSTNVEYKEFGIKLKIKPAVVEDNRVKLNLYVEVSDVGESIILGPSSAPTAVAFPLSKRNASTELYLNDGQTMAIGGLIKQKTEEDLRKFPWLGDVPVLGAFFRQRVTKIGKGAGQRGDTELFITLTPTIVARDIPKQQKASSSKISPQKSDLLNNAVPKNVANYIRAVQEKILKASYYPQQAQDAGWEGNIKLSLNIAANGDLKNLKIARSSGYNILDDAALDVARTQAPYPPFPPQIESQELLVDVPITYKKN